MGIATGKTEPCPACRGQGRDRAGDNLVCYDDDSKHCFACGYDQQVGGYRDEEGEDMIGFEDVASLPVMGLKARGVDHAIAKRYGVHVECDEQTGEEAAYYFPLYKGTTLAGYQRKAARAPGARRKGDVSRVGDTKGVLPFGAHCVGHGGMLVVTEGAEDCLMAVQMLKEKGKNYRTVATLGTTGWASNLEFFHKFDKVVIAYDQDEAGQQAANKFAEALPAGKAAIMRWDSSLNDPNALGLAHGGSDKFLTAIMQAKPYQPGGIVYGEEVWRRMENYVTPKYIPYPPDWKLMNKKVGGIREAEITMLVGGSGLGKTSITRHLKAHMLANTDWRIGEVELEERGEKTWRGLMETQLGRPWEQASPAERRAAYEQTYGTNRIFTLDHRAQHSKGQSLIGKFKHLHYNMGCKALFLDHITLAVNEWGETGGGNQAQDQMMGEFLELVESTGVHLFLIAHLRKTGQSGTSFEEGAVPSADDIKGSASQKQITFNILGISRNIQCEDEYERNVSQLWVLKCRETGRTGPADRLYWDDSTRSLSIASDKQGEDNESEF